MNKTKKEGEMLIDEEAKKDEQWRMNVNRWRSKKGEQ